MLCTSELAQTLSQAERLWLFLDYDGTLSDFAPTPEHVHPDPEVIDLLNQLAEHPRIRVTIISGRRLDQIETLVPVPEVFLTGTYGIEMRTWSGERINRLDYEIVRPALDALKPHWSQLVASRRGFFLEDKGWSLALHARFAADGEAEAVLNDARRIAFEAVFLAPFRVLNGHKFLEVGPLLAHKGRTVDYLLSRYPWPGAFPLYLGDDDKDEEAFGAVKARGGLAIVVAPEPRETKADCRLKSPGAARRWLRSLLALLEERSTVKT
jgi:trehalose 6-phosphate phosphatase